MKRAGKQRISAPFAGWCPAALTLDLFYSASAKDDEGFLARISRAGEEAGFRVHILRTATDGRLDADRICELVPDWQEAELWFCGPGAFGNTLRDGLVAKGFSADDFHQELLVRSSKKERHLVRLPSETRLQRC